MFETPNRGTSLPPASSWEIESKSTKITSTSSIMDYACLIMLPNQKTAQPFHSPELETTYGQSNGDTLTSEAQNWRVEKAYLNEMTKEVQEPSLMVGSETSPMIQDIKQKYIAMCMVVWIYQNQRILPIWNGLLKDRKVMLN
jgi:hypothetical protein